MAIKGRYLYSLLHAIINQFGKDKVYIERHESIAKQQDNNAAKSDRSKEDVYAIIAYNEREKV